jgi:hypothetical protein
MARDVDTDDGGIGGAGNPLPGANGSSEDPNIRGKNLRDSNNVTLRPLVLTSAHLYNLRNQGWSISRALWDGDDVSTQDLITQFRNVATNRFPSNSDNPNYSIYPNTVSNSNKFIDRFNPKDLAKNPLGTSLAPMGYFILDAMERGQSRIDNVNQRNVTYATDYVISTLPADSTPGGASVVCEFAGRVFYAGFSGVINDGDHNSPRMSSYVLFSQVVRDTSAITNCYQVADPTNKEDSNLVDSDGGFIRIEGAYNITGLANIGSNLVVLGSNGIWLISGGNNFGFKATDYKVTKIGSSGCISPGSVVVVDNTLYYWAADGIYQVAPNQFGDYLCNNITKMTIQTLYDGITTLDAQASEGVYDSYEKKVKWLYGNRISSSLETHELVFDLVLQAFYKHIIHSTTGIYPKVIKGVITEPFKDSSDLQNVVSNSVQVTASGDIVVTTGEAISSEVREVRYLSILGANPQIQYSFSTYNEPNHYDWKSLDGVGIDADSFLVTGVLSGGDFQRNKDVPYIVCHFKKTEDGFIEDENGDFTPTNQSSCLLSSQWDWTNSYSSGKWTRKVQAYRFKRHYIPVNLDDKFDNGYYVVTTRDRLRGFGKAFSIRVDSEPGKHMEFLGWSLMFNINGAP